MYEKIKVIFLDFDGVITTPYSNYEPSLHQIELVRRILDATNSYIVISSSWRPYNYYFEKHTYDQQEIIDAILVNPYNNEYTSILFPYIIGCTERVGNSTRWNWINPRGTEIEWYLADHPEIDNYIILDDEDINPVNKEMREHFIRTNHFDGITEEDSDRAIELLNKQ